MGVVGSSTVSQGTQEKSPPPVHWVTGRQTFVLTVDTAVACEPASVPLSCSSGASENKMRAFVEVCVSRGEILAYCWSKKKKKENYKFVHIGVDKNSLTTCVTPSPRHTA